MHGSRADARSRAGASRWLAFAAVGALVASTAWAQTISSVSNLWFGNFLAGSGGTVTVGTSGGRSKTGGVVLIGQGSGTSAAQFTVQGTSGAAYSITLPVDNSVTLSDGNANTMGLNAFVSSPSGSGTLSGGGIQVLSVGATLLVGGGQPPGNYSGSFSVTVDYQ